MSKPEAGRNGSSEAQEAHGNAKPIKLMIDPNADRIGARRLTVGGSKVNQLPRGLGVIAPVEGKAVNERIAASRSRAERPGIVRFDHLRTESGSESIVPSEPWAGPRRRGVIRSNNAAMMDFYLPAHRPC